MSRPEYLSNHLFDWELLEVVLCGRSPLDSKFFIASLNNLDEVDNFLMGYGINPDDPVNKAELFGTFQEAIQFIKRYFLKEGSADGLDLSIPNSILMVSNVSTLFWMATGNSENTSHEERLWAEIILKVMHTILHVDKDLRSNYFSTIQQQVFDRFYKYIYREEENLYFGTGSDGEKIELIEFETKSKKTRDSVIIKLLHKAENVAEELFDRIGIRIVTKNRYDTLRIIKYLINKNVIIPHNLKPSRSINTIFDIQKFKYLHHKVIKQAIREDLSEEDFLKRLEGVLLEAGENLTDNDRNLHSSSDYRSIQVTCRQLIKYKNPFLQQFNKLKKFANETNPEDEITKKIMSMDVSLIARDIRFFYPFEIQIVDEESHRINTEGEASHAEYKRQQILSAMKRVFWALLEYKQITLD